MTTAALPFTDWSFWDSAQGQEGQSLRRMVGEARSATLTDASFSLAEKYRELQEVMVEAAVPDWDGYGAAPVNLQAVQRAWDLLELLPSWVPKPMIAPEADGEVLVEWRSGPRWALAISVDASGRLAYSAILGKREHFGNERLGDEVPQTITVLLSDFAAAAPPVP